MNAHADDLRLYTRRDWEVVFLQALDVSGNGFSDVLDCLFPRVALGITTWQGRTGDCPGFS